MDGGHQALGDAEAFLQQHVHDRREAVGGAGGVGDDVVVGRIVKIVIDAHHHDQVFALGRGGDDDLLGASLDMALGFLGLSEQSGGLDHDIHAEFLPRQAAGFAGADDFHLIAVDKEGVVSLVSHLTRERALCGVIFHQVGEVVSRDDVAHGHHVDRVADEALFYHCTISQSADSAESVDCYFYCHIKKEIVSGCCPEIGAGMVATFAQPSMGFFVACGPLGQVIGRLESAIAPF